MYNTILLAVALQDWERYSDHAIALRDLGQAVALGSAKQLHVLSVYHHDKPPDGIGLTPEMAAEAREDLRLLQDAKMRQKLNEYVAPLEEIGVDIIPHLEVGDPREKILQVARHIRAEILLLGSHSKRGRLDVALGGTARQISRRAPCLVALVSPKTAH